MRINALCPGWTATDLNRNLWLDPTAGPATIATVPMGRWGKPEEMARAVVFLATSTGSYAEVPGLVSGSPDSGLLADDEHKPQLLAELESTQGDLPRKLSAETAKTLQIDRITMDKATFDRMHAVDRMANDKLKEGIEGFSAALVKLETLLAKRLAELGSRTPAARGSSSPGTRRCRSGRSAPTPCSS